MNEIEAMQLELLRKQMAILQENLDQFFMIINGMFIFFMQCGFAFLEAGSVRSSNTVNILMKNTLDVFVGSLSFFAFGYPFAYGRPGNSFIGHNNFFGANVQYFEKSVIANNQTLGGYETSSSYFANFFFQYVFAATAATVVSGAVAERADFSCYIIYSFTITGFIYPVGAHWVWSPDGWLNTGAGTGLSMQDYAGSCVVHVCGGMAALAGAKILGPRLGRFSDDGADKPIPGHSVPLVSLGAFILLVGFLCFNGSSIQRISKNGDGLEVSLSVTNTILSGSAAGLSSMLTHRVHSMVKGKGKYWSLLMTINGGLTGMVASCAGCNDIAPWAALLIGSVAGVVFVFARQFVLWLKIDDPLDAISVHLFGGTLGTIATPIFAIRGQTINGVSVGGPIYGGGVDAWRGFGWSLVGLFSIGLWSGLCCFTLFTTLDMVGLMRIPKSVEESGIDMKKHGEHAYPETYVRIIDDKPETPRTNKVVKRNVASALVDKSLPAITTSAWDGHHPSEAGSSTNGCIEDPTRLSPSTAYNRK
ncbi:ammonium transporter 1 [Ciona intestinalis]